MISPSRRYEIAAVNALSAALWSSTDADRMFTIIRPSDFHPVDDTIAAAILDLRRRNVDWFDPIPVVENLRDWRQLWRDRVDSGKFGIPEMPVPVDEYVDPNRSLLRFASRPLISGRVYNIQTHIAEADIETSAREIAGIRRHEVADATMQTVRRLLTNAPTDSTRQDRQQAVARVIRDYRRDMLATHLYPRRPSAAADRSGVDLGR